MGTGFYGSNDPTNSVKALKEDRSKRSGLRQSKGYSARKLLEEFPDKDWSCSALDRLLQQIDAATGSADRKSVSSREHTVCTRHANVCANGDHFEHKL